MRVLLLAPIGRDADLLAGTINALGVETAIAADARTLFGMLAEGFGAAIIADEAISSAQIHELTTWLSSQPPWSDPPFIILMPSGRPTQHHLHRAQEFSILGNFTLVERPMRPETIQSSVRSALRGRMKQYEIRSRQEALTRANADLEQFAHSASHDLKEPLRTINLYSQMLASKYGDGLDPKGIGFLELIQSSAQRMESLLADLLSYAQTSNIPEDLPEPIASAKSLEAALSNLASAIQESGAQITVGELPEVRMRESHLVQLFQNLIGNAIKYRKENCSPRIRLTSQRSAESWIFSVADDGIGIKPDYRQTIFGIFQRLHTNGEYSGTGMGLAICQRIVERYGGRIWVESESGKGSTFLFTIPA
jgi:signal transduction histidine kinase